MPKSKESKAFFILFLEISSELLSIKAKSLLRSSSFSDKTISPGPNENSCYLATENLDFYGFSSVLVILFLLFTIDYRDD